MSGVPPTAATAPKRKKINKQIYKNNGINQIVRNQINGKPEPNIHEFMNLFCWPLLSELFQVASRFDWPKCSFRPKATILQYAKYSLDRSHVLCLDIFHH